jgi:hypothetical protein
MYSPAMKYVLPAIAVEEGKFHTVQAKYLSSLLRKIGASRMTPTAVRHGPRELGGLDLMDLRTESGISRIKYMFDAVYRKSETGKLLILNVKASQLESGLSKPLLEHPNIHITYLTDTWVTSLRTFLALHKLKITLTDHYKVLLKGKWDRTIMSLEALTRYTLTQQRDINRARIFLQAMTLSDLTSPLDRHTIDSHALHGTRDSSFVPSKAWPIQPSLTSAQRKLWKNYITSTYLRYDNKWKNSPIDCPTTTTQAPPADPTTYNSLTEYLASLPLWQQRLFCHFDQIADDLTIWKAFRSKRWLDIISDGGLSHSVGTFGWKIVDRRRIPLFQGSGPIDGPTEVGSSTRSELGGFTAPLVLIQAISRYWGLKHRCKFYWIVDSKAAMAKVKMYSQRGKI